MRSAVFTGNQRAYLLGTVVLHLKREVLIEHDREIYEHLRDILAVGMELDADVRRAAGLDPEDDDHG